MSGDFRAAIGVKHHPVKLGDVHLHFLYRRSPQWVVRTRRSGLCDTPRCQLVHIEPRPEVA